MSRDGAAAREVSTSTRRLPCPVHTRVRLKGSREPIGVRLPARASPGGARGALLGRAARMLANPNPPPHPGSRQGWPEPGGAGRGRVGWEGSRATAAVRGCWSRRAQRPLAGAGSSTGQTGTTSAWPTWTAATAPFSSPTRKGLLVRNPPATPPCGAPSGPNSLQAPPPAALAPWGAGSWFVLGDLDLGRPFFPSPLPSHRSDSDGPCVLPGC